MPDEHDLRSAGGTRGRTSWQGRSDLDLARRQLEAVEAYNASRRQSEEALAATVRSREMRMDSARRLEVLRREHDALVQRSHEQLALTGGLLRSAGSPRVVVAHRNAWFVDRVSSGLADRGLQVVARVDNGAETVGLVVAEQPDLLLVEDTLAMVPGEQVVARLRTLCPDLLIAAHVAHGDQVDLFLRAGAAGVFTRRVPPADVAASIVDLLGV
ncbi:MAG: hypothetical protein JWN17_2693 [Frankiales bacterium]|nr:hypothetical protein [Frankiales bacterium]